MPVLYTASVHYYCHCEEEKAEVEMNDGSLRSGTVSVSWRRPKPLPRRQRPPTTTLTQLASRSSKWHLIREFKGNEVPLHKVAKDVQQLEDRLGDSTVVKSSEN